MHQIVYELHVVLEKAGVRPSLLWPGTPMEVGSCYATKYPAEVAGVVLVEGGFDNPWRMVNGKLVRAGELVTGKPIPAVKTCGPFTKSDIPADAFKQMKPVITCGIADEDGPGGSVVELERRKKEHADFAKSLSP